MADHDSHDAASHAFLEDAESVVMQLIELSERVRERHRQIQELMADQEMDQQRERKLLSMLDGQISEGRHRHLQDQRAWKSEVDRVADRVQADWAARAAAAEREIEHQKVRHQQEVAKLHHSLQEAVSSARKLEARLDSQQTAASVVMHAAAQDSLMQRRVASITHNRQHLDRSRASQDDSASAPGGRHPTRQQQQEQHHPHAASGVLSDVGSTSAESIRVDEALYTKFREVDRKAYEYKKDLHKERETNHRLAAEVDSLRQELALASKDHTPVRQHQQQHPAAPAVTGTGGAHSQHTPATPPTPIRLVRDSKHERRVATLGHVRRRRRERGATNAAAAQRASWRSTGPRRADPRRRHTDAAAVADPCVCARAATRRWHQRVR
jgi:hypothetical protein